MKFTDLILDTVTKLLVYIILTVAIYLFFAGHHTPGGGFVGGLITACALLLLFMAFDIETVAQMLPIDFKNVAALGVLIAVLTGVASLLMDQPFLNQSFGTVDFPLVGEVELATAVLFDLGVYLAVVGTAVVILLSISEER